MKFIAIILLALAYIALVYSQDSEEFLSESVQSTEDEIEDDNIRLRRGFLAKIGKCFNRYDCLPTEYCDNLTGKV